MHTKTTITPEDLQMLTSTIKLSPSQEQLTVMAAQLTQILQKVQDIHSVDTTDVPPLFSPFTENIPLREDKAIKTTTPEQIVSNAKEHDKNFFVVPKIV